MVNHPNGLSQNWGEKKREENHYIPQWVILFIEQH